MGHMNLLSGLVKVIKTARAVRSIKDSSCVVVVTRVVSVDAVKMYIKRRQTHITMRLKLPEICDK